MPREVSKPYEKLRNEVEGTKPTFHKKIYSAQFREYAFDEVSCKI